METDSSSWDYRELPPSLSSRDAVEEVETRRNEVVHGEPNPFDSPTPSGVSG